MKLKFFTTFLFVIGFLLLQAEAADLFFSEYVEGSSQNKALEIFNGTGEAVDLSNYRIAVAVNGGGWSAYHTFPDGAEIADGDVWIIANTGCLTEIADLADEVTGTAGIATFNGNDARGLQKSIDDTNWETIDIFGVPEYDASITSWSVAGIDDATINHTLVRKENVIQGTTDWPASAGTNVIDSEWIVFEEDNFSYIGSHTYNGGVDETAPVATAVQVMSAIEIKIIFNEALDEGSATNLSNYTITPDLTLSGAVLDLNKVTLTTSEQTGGEVYFLTINNVEDLAGNSIALDSELQFTGYTGVQYDAIADIQNNFDEYDGSQVTVHGTVLIGDNLLQTGNTKIYIQDESGRGIQIFDYDPPAEQLHRGDAITVSGTVDLYTSGGSSYDVQVGGDDIEITSNNNALPEYFTIEPTIPNTYNGTWGYVKGTVDDIYYHSTFTKITVKNDSVEVPVMFWNTTGAVVDTFSVGEKVEAQGVISFFNGTLQLLGGYSEDIWELHIPPTPIRASLDVDNHPFSPRMGQSISINFKVGTGNKFILRMYNAEGKLVATPINDISSEVTGTYLWDGKDKHGHILPIGLYICHLEVIEVSSGRKKTATAPIVIATKLK